MGVVNRKKISELIESRKAIFFRCEHFFSSMNDVLTKKVKKT